MDDTESSRSLRDLDSWMNERRRELRIRWTEVAERASMSAENLRKIRRGQISISEDAADGIENALAWKPGSVKSVMRGGSPTRIRDTGTGSRNWPEPPSRVDPTSAAWSDLRQELAWWHKRLDSREDYERLQYLLELSAQMENRPLSTQSGAQVDAQG